jgi:phosphoribosylformylglycinamidine cyclo-ligase
MGIYDTIGEDLVAMVVDDLVVCGAEPLFMTDYIAVGKVIPERIAAIVSGIARGCQKANTALIGGETAEHPGLMSEDEFDIAGAATGAVDADKQLGAHRVQEGDLLIAMPASGFHANGYSLVRHILATQKLDLQKSYQGFEKSLGEILLTPTEIYTLDCLALIKAQHENIRTFSHITGGGLLENTERILPPTVDLVFRRGSWPVLPVFDWIAKLGDVASSEMEHVFNMGVGFVLVVRPYFATNIQQMIQELGYECWPIGEAVQGAGKSRYA